MHKTASCAKWTNSAPKFQTLLDYVHAGTILHQNKFFLFFFLVTESEGNRIFSAEICTAFFFSKERGKVSQRWHLVEIRRAAGSRDARSGISCPDKPECVKTYHEAVAEQWAKKQITLYSFYRATSGSSYTDAVKWNSKFQPPVPQTGFVVQGCISQNLICSLWMHEAGTSRLLRAEDCVSNLIWLQGVWEISICPFLEQAYPLLRLGA